MITCTKRIRNNSGLITHYILMDVDTFRERKIPAKELRLGMMKGNIRVNNLKLSASNSILLVDTKRDNVDKQSAPKNIGIGQNTNIEYSIQGRDSIALYKEMVEETELRFLTEEETQALNKIGGFWVGYGKGKGTLKEILNKLLQIAQDEYKEETKSNNGFEYKIHKVQEFTKDTIKAESIINDAASEHKYYIAVNVKDKGNYNHKWRLCFNII